MSKPQAMSLTESPPDRNIGLPRALGAVLGLAVAFLIYRPDRSLPFDILDFSEFLPVLDGSDSFLTRARSLAEYYASQGRANLVPYVLMSLKWTWFADWSPGWQWSRFVAMAACVVLAFRLLERLGATRMGAMAGAAVLLAHPAAARGWIRLTMAEPLGTLLLLLLCLWVLPGAHTRRPSWPWAAVVTMVPLILLTKEMLVVALALPTALLCLVDPDGRLARPSLRPAASRFFLSAGLVSAAVLAPLVLLMIRAPGEAFTAQYGSATRSLGDTVATWLATVILFDPGRTFPPRLLGLALALLVGLLTWGWWTAIRRAEDRATAWGLLAVGIAFPMLGAVAYIPWPAYQTFYAIPFLLGTAIVVAFAASAMESRSRPVAAGWYAGYAFLVFASLADANGQAGRAAASQKVHARLVRRVSQLRAVDSVLVASDRVVPQRWQGLGPTLARYAAATGNAWPPTRDVSCTGVDALESSSSAMAVVFYSSLCPRARDSAPIIERYRHLDPGMLRVVDDSLRVDVELRDRAPASNDR
jgi:hypothetical protein